MLENKKRIIKLLKDFETVDKKIRDAFKLCDEISPSDIHTKDLKMLDTIEKTLDECINELPNSELKIQLLDKFKQTPLNKCYSKNPSSYQVVNGGFFFKVNFINVLNNWWKIIDSLKQHYNIDDAPIEEVQQFQIEAITINKGVVSDKYLEIIESDLDELKKNIATGCWQSASTLIGAILEALLSGVAEKFPEKFESINQVPQKKDGTKIALSKWNLDSLINGAIDLGIIRKDKGVFSHHLRDYRNLIHPKKRIQDQFRPDKNTVLISRAVLKGIVDDLKVHAETVHHMLEDQ